VRFKSCLALALAGAMSISAAFATTLQEMSLKDMARQADVAIVGKVIAARTVKTDAGFETITTFSVIENGWGADKASTLEVSTPGGSTQIGRFKVGQINAGAFLPIKDAVSVLLLANGSQSGKYVIVGFNQGNFQVVKTATGSAVMLPKASKLMPLAQAMANIKQARLAPASDNGLAP
jgi:hypothetical protein